MVTNCGQTVMVTGGAGFIGSELIRYFINNTHYNIVNIDKLTYAGNLSSLNSVKDNSRYAFEQADIQDAARLKGIFQKYRPMKIFHLAAESHVDRSIDSPINFLETNVMGTYQLLQESRIFYEKLPESQKSLFRFLHISTDEVFGSLGETGLFSETTPYSPRSPYSASKAASDHLVMAWHHTYKFPVLVSNCSNNYGPYQFPEKLIPHIIICATQGKKLPVYGRGTNIRDWLYVSDHVKALLLIMEQGRVGETYNIGGNCEVKNIEVVQKICSVLDELKPVITGDKYGDYIEYVQDRPGHDFRYAMDTNKISMELGWKPEESFDSGLRKTICWYLENQNWWMPILDKKYKISRLGLSI